MGVRFRPRSNRAWAGVAVVCVAVLLVDGLSGVAAASSSPVKELNVGLSTVAGIVNSVSTVRNNDTSGPDYIMFYSFNSSNETELTGNFSAGTGCSGDCQGVSYPFIAANTSTLKFWLMDEQTVSGKSRLYPVYINGKSDSFSLTVYGTGTAYWCIKSLKTCSHTYNLTGTSTSSVPRSANVSLAVEEEPLVSFQVGTRASLYSNYTGVFYQLTQTQCPSWIYNQDSLANIAPLILIPIGLGFFALSDYPAIEAVEFALHLATDKFVNEFFSSSTAWNASIVFPNGVPDLPFLCTNMYYTMYFADGGTTPAIYNDLVNMEALVATEQGLVNSNIKPDNASLLENLESQESTLTQASSDLAGLNASLTTFVNIPSSCQVYYGGFDGLIDGPCAPYAQYMITTFMDPVANELVADLNYTTSAYALFHHSS